MATVRIHYKRSDENYDDYQLYYMPGEHQGDKDLLFPDNDTDGEFHEFPRTGLDFTVEGDLGYVDLDFNGSKVADVYIRRKDFGIEYGKELCGSFCTEPLCGFCGETGYKYIVSETYYSEVFIKENSEYLFTDNTYSAIAPQKIVLQYSEEVSDDEETLHDTVEHGDPGVDTELHYTYAKIYNTYRKSTTIQIPQETLDLEVGHDMDLISTVLMLYLCGNTYDIGESMDLSIDADALAVEKADALQMVDKAIANCLYKLGEVPADFDEDAFQADVAAYKATKSDVLANTVDYLEELLTTRPNLV